jgi:hypothetical protein
MAQTESMSRLIKDGKIVGYEYHTTINSQSNIQAIYHSTDKNIRDNIVNLLDYTDDEIEYVIIYDSFEQGIKIYDNWYFEGDVTHWKGINELGRNVDEKHIIVFNGFEFTLDGYTDLQFAFNNQNIKIIGNVHDNPELLKEK